MSIISYSKKFVFVHMAKTGGTSVAHWLQPLTSPGDLIFDNSFKDIQAPLIANPKYGIWKHGAARSFRDFINEQGLDWDDFLTFATIRDPFDRTYSSYMQIKRNFPDLMKNDFNIQEWIRGFEAAKDVNEFVEGIAFDNLVGPSFFIGAQAEGLCDYDGTLVVKHLINTKDINEKLPRLFGSDRKMIVTWGVSVTEPPVWSDAARKIIEDKFAVDFELLRYTI